MRFAFLLSNYGGSPLEGGLSRGLVSLGHEVVSFHTGKERNYDALVIFNQTAHSPGHVYPEFPTYEIPVAFVDSAEYGWMRRWPHTVTPYANAFTEGSMNHDGRNPPEQARLRDFLQGRSFPYFLREFSNYISYPENYHPIDYPLYHLSHCSDRPDRGDYLRRLIPFWVCWGASHPFRWVITRALRESGVTITTHDGTFGVEVLVIEENGQPRIDQSTYFNWMVRSRASVTYDGYGTGSFRLTEVLMRTCLLLGPLSTRAPFPLVDGQTCVAYDLEVKGEECLGTNIVEKLRWIVEHPEDSFRIYEAGYDHCLTKLTERATAQYFLDTLARHDWSKETSLLPVC